MRCRHPRAVRGCRVQQQVEQGQVSPQDPSVSVRHHRIEPAERRQALPRVLPHPCPRTHLERERQQRTGARGDPPIVEVVPQVAADRVRLRGLLQAIDVVRERLVEQVAERTDRREIGGRLARACVRVPQPIDDAVTGVEIEREREPGQGTPPARRARRALRPRPPSVRPPVPCTRAAAATAAGLRAAACRRMDAPVRCASDPRRCRSLAGRVPCQPD